jgi:transcriptional regulator with XRE-family HTH domain
MAGTSNIFGQWLRDKRVAKGFTLRKFAEQVGVSPTEMPELLREASGLTGEQLRRLTEHIRKLKEGEKNE